MKRLERWLLEFGLKSGYLDLVKDILSVCDDDDASDVYWLLAALRVIIDGRIHFKYGVACQLIDLLHRACPGDFLSVQEYSQITFLLKLMLILSRIGNETTQEVVQLLEEHFGSDSIREKDTIQDFHTKVHNDLYRTTREYVLKLMLNDERINHFTRSKFPATFNDLDIKIKQLTLKLIDTAWISLPAPKLELLANGMSFEEIQSQDDPLEMEPPVYLYLDKFPSGTKPSQIELIVFLQIVRNEKMSLTPPDFESAFKQEISDSQCIALSEEKQVNSSLDLFATPVDENNLIESEQPPQVERPPSIPTPLPPPKPSDLLEKCTVELVPLERTVYRKFLKKELD